MANLITVNSFNELSIVGTNGKVAKPISINVKNIIGVKTRTNPYLTTGVTDILYSLPVNNTNYQVNLIVTETASAVVTAANAAPEA